MKIGGRILIIVTWLLVLIFGHGASPSGIVLYLVILKCLFLCFLWTHHFSKDVKLNIAGIEILTSLIFTFIYFVTDYMDIFEGWPNQIFLTLVEFSIVGLILTLVYNTGKSYE